MDSTINNLDFSVLSWNVRGAYNDNSKRHIKELIIKYRPNLIFIMETHIYLIKLRIFGKEWDFNPFTLWRHKVILVGSGPWHRWAKT